MKIRTWTAHVNWKLFQINVIDTGINVYEFDTRQFRNREQTCFVLC